MVVKFGAPILSLISKVGLNTCEKVHLRICKIFLEVNRKASNIATEDKTRKKFSSNSFNEVSLEVLSTKNVRAKVLQYNKLFFISGISRRGVPSVIIVT